MTKIVLVSGSHRKGSTTRTVINEFQKALEKNGAQTEIIDLAEIELPFFDHRDTWDYGPEAKRVSEILDGADGFVFGTPEYHASLSGTLKNFLDLLNFKKVLAGKPVAFCAVGGGRSRAMSVLDHLMIISRALQLWPVPRVIGANHEDFDKTTYQLSSKLVLERIGDVSADLVKVASKK